MFHELDANHQLCHLVGEPGGSESLRGFGDASTGPASIPRGGHLPFSERALPTAQVRSPTCPVRGSRVSSVARAGPEESPTTPAATHRTPPAIAHILRWICNGGTHRSETLAAPRQRRLESARRPRLTVGTLQSPRVKKGGRSGLGNPDGAWGRWRVCPASQRTLVAGDREYMGGVSVAREVGMPSPLRGPSWAT